MHGSVRVAVVIGEHVEPDQETEMFLDLSLPQREERTG